MDSKKMLRGLRAHKLLMANYGIEDFRVRELAHSWVIRVGKADSAETKDVTVPKKIVAKYVQHMKDKEAGAVECVKQVISVQVLMWKHKDSLEKQQQHQDALEAGEPIDDGRE